MGDRRTLRGWSQRDVAAALGRPIHAAALMLAAAAPIVFTAALVPSTVVLPVLSVAALIAAAGVALAAWRSNARAHGNAVTLWDIAGASALIGCGAAMLSKPENVVDLFGRVIAP
jgi:hypothetical protein